jgi:hypothetical protein
MLLAAGGTKVMEEKFAGVSAATVKEKNHVDD